MIAPTPEKAALAPIAEFLTTVGNSSAEKRYIVANAAEDPNFPIIDRTNTTVSVAVKKIKSVVLNSVIEEGIFLKDHTFLLT